MKLKNSKDIHWFEAKQLDSAINFSSRTEIIKAAINLNVKIQYYCSFKTEKKNFGLEKNIHYLGYFKNRYFKAIEFRILVILKTLQIILTKKNQVIIANQFIILLIIPSYFVSKLFNRKNKFIVDIRTTPVTPSTFDHDMVLIHKQFKLAIKYFDGLSFITPFMGEYMMERYSRKMPVVFWSSGVNLSLFDYSKYNKNIKNDEIFKVFYHGSICESRGNLCLIQACEKLVKKGYKINLTQIGSTEGNKIKTYIEENKISKWCKLLPTIKIDEIPQYIADSDLPVLPFPNFMAWRVSSPIKLMEYLAMGKKVLAPDMEAFTEVFRDNSNLIHYYDSKKTDQVEELSLKIEEIINNQKHSFFSPDEAINFVKENYTWDIQGNKLIIFCQSI